MKEVICGIYKITNQIDGKVYIGQSVNIQRRWKEHKINYKVSHDKQHNIYLYNAIKKYGLENFNFEIIEQCSPEELDDREIYWIKYYESFNKEKGYNLTRGGGGKRCNYDEIFQLWEQGYKCKEIMEKLNCGRNVVTLALRLNGISEQDAKFKSAKKQYIVALSEDKIPLKIFAGLREASRYLKGDSYKLNVSEAIKYGRRAAGYYWEYLNEYNKPERELSKEEFLSYQGKNRSYTEEQKEQMSLQRRTVERPCREELKRMIREMSFTQIGKEYNVSDNAIRKWCYRYNLPIRKRDINAITDEDWKEI